MAVSRVAVFPQLPFHSSAVATAANTTLSDAADANVVELALPSDIQTDGGQLTRAWALPRATTPSATVLYLYISTDNGTTKRLALTAVSSSADTVSTTDGPTMVVFRDAAGNELSIDNPLLLPAGSGSSTTKIYFGASVALAGGWACHAQGFRYTAAS